MELKRTYDGEPIAPEPPYGAAIVVTRSEPAGRTFLILHRARKAPEGDWAWTPPSGCRKPGERVAAAAARELREETGLTASPVPLLTEDTDWAVFLLEVSTSVEIYLDGEHDRFAWVGYAEALERCAPEVVRDNLRLARERLG